MTVNFKLELNQIVYLITDPHQLERMVTAAIIRPYGAFYELSCGTETTWHHYSEICEIKNYLKSESN